MAAKVTKEHLQRAGWLALAGLFLLTALAGIITFWVGTHQPDTSASDAAKAQATAACQFQLVEGAKTLPAPEVVKPTTPVAKLEVTDLQEGSGPGAKADDCITVKYYGTLATTGAVFDEDFSKTEALKVQLGAGQVIPGWDQGLIGMKAGGLRRLVIPASLAYGSQAQGAVPANSDLVFVVSMTSIN